MRTAPAPGLLGSDTHDDLSLGKKQFRADNYGLAEQHFRKAVETHPKDAEAWLGLAAANDRLRRFDFADRAYKKRFVILGRPRKSSTIRAFPTCCAAIMPAPGKPAQGPGARSTNPYILNNHQAAGTKLRISAKGSNSCGLITVRLPT